MKPPIETGLTLNTLTTVPHGHTSLAAKLAPGAVRCTAPARTPSINGIRWRSHQPFRLDLYNPQSPSIRNPKPIWGFPRRNHRKAEERREKRSPPLRGGASQPPPKKSLAAAAEEEHAKRGKGIADDHRCRAPLRRGSSTTTAAATDRTTTRKAVLRTKVIPISLRPAWWVSPPMCLAFEPWIILHGPLRTAAFTHAPTSVRCGPADVALLRPWQSHGTRTRSLAHPLVSRPRGLTRHARGPAFRRRDTP
nr:unnamed protein product [Digitaria exilis]